jgi:trimethylamine---corrinoid protein Co-methyltransferase
MATPRITLMSEAEKDFVHEQTVRVLEEVGVAYNSPQAIDLLEKAGALVDRERLTARLSWPLVEECLRLVPGEVLLAGRDSSRDRVMREGGLLFTSDGAATNWLDDETGVRREGSTEDLRRMARLFDALDEIDFVWATITPLELDPVTAGLELAFITLENCAKHVQDEVRFPEQVDSFVGMLEAIAGASLHERPIYSVTSCTIAPLQHDREMTEAHMAMARAGVPIFILPMPQMGTTGPMSTLGCTIVNMAELLSAVVLFQLAAPGCSLVSGVGVAAAEMRSGLYLCGTPEVAIINVMCIEMNKRYGLLSMGSGVTSDAKGCDLQAGAEGMMTGMAAALAGAECVLAFGLIDGAQTASLAKTVLDADTVGMIRRFCRPEPIDAAKALMDDIVEVGIGGHYLGRRSTRTLARAGELWRPALFRRGPWEEFAARPLAADAAQRARELIASHEVPPLADDARAEARRIIERYAERASV